MHSKIKPVPPFRKGGREKKKEAPIRRIGDKKERYKPLKDGSSEVWMPRHASSAALHALKRVAMSL